MKTNRDLKWINYLVPSLLLILLIALGVNVVSSKTLNLHATDSNQKKLTKASTAPIEFSEAWVEKVDMSRFNYDNQDGEGYVTQETAEKDYVIRSNDSFSPFFAFQFQTLDGNNYKDIAIRLVGELENGITSDGSMLNAEISTAYNGNYDFETKKVTMDYTMEPASGFHLTNQSTAGVEIPIQVWSAFNGTKLKFRLTAQIISVTNEKTGEVIDLSESGIIVDLSNQIPEITVTSQVNLGAMVRSAVSNGVAPYRDVTQTEDRLNDNIRQLGFSVGVLPINGRTSAQGLLGAAAPLGEVTLTIDQDIFKGTDNSPANQSVDNFQLELFDYGYVRDNVKYPQQSGTLSKQYSLDQLKYNLLPPGNLYVPYSFGENRYAVYDSGTKLFMQGNADGTFDLTFKDYVIDLNFIPTMGAATNSIPSNTQWFLSMGSYFVVPTGFLEEEYTNASYKVTVTKIKYKNEQGNIEEKSRDDYYKWSYTERGEGAVSVLTKYRDTQGNTLGSTPGGWTPSGDSVASAGQGLSVQTYAKYTNKYYGTSLLQKWNPYESKINYASGKTDSANASKIKYTIEYGVSNTDDYSVSALNANTEKEYTWYKNVQQAQKNGIVSAVLCRTEGDYSQNNYAAVVVYRTVLENLGVSINTNGEDYPFATISNAKIYTTQDLSEENAISAPAESDFVPTTYDETGVKDLQTPNASYGDTLLVAPYTITVKKLAYDTDSTTAIAQNSFNGNQTIYWRIFPEIVTKAKGELEPVSISIKDTLPKGLKYIAGTSKVGVENKEPDEIRGPDKDGKTYLVWNLEAIPGETAPEISYATTIVQADVDFSGGLGSVTNVVEISSPGILSNSDGQKDSKSVQIVNAKSWEITKSTLNPLLEGSNEPITYNIRLSNMWGTDLEDVKLVDILPQQGTAGSNFHGSYQLISAKVLADDQVQEIADAQLYYTNDLIDKNVDPNTLGQGNSLENWTLIDSSTIQSGVDATAVYAHIVNIPDKKTYYLQIQIKIKDCEAGDTYINEVVSNNKTIPGKKSDTTMNKVVDRQISGIVWWDGNYNGRLDDIEGFVTDIPVNLYKVDEIGNLTQVMKNLKDESFVDDNQVVTDENGSYTFNALPAGNYVVGFDVGEKVDNGEYFITKPYAEINGIPVANSINSKVDVDEREGSNLLTFKDKFFVLPTTQEMIAKGLYLYQEIGVNMGLLTPPAIEVEKKVYDNLEELNDIDHKTVKIGESIYYEIIVRNPRANSSLENVKIQDELPEGLKYKLGTLRLSTPSNGDEWAVLHDSAFNDEGTILSTGSLGKLSGSNQVIKIGFEVEVTPQASGDLKNIATANGKFQEKEYLPEKEAQVDNNAPPSPRITKEVDANEAVTIGNILTFTIEVKNDEGAGQWFNANVSDKLPIELSYIPNSSDIKGSEDESWMPLSDNFWQGNSLSYPLGNMTSGMKYVIRFQAQVVAFSNEVDHVIKNVAVATGAKKDGSSTDEVEDEAVVYAYKTQLNIRQVVLSPNEDLVIPLQGFFNVSISESKDGGEGHSIGIGTKSLNIQDATADSKEEVKENLFTDVLLHRSKDETVIKISDYIPEYYEYAGHIQTTDSSFLNEEHLSSKKDLFSNDEIYLDYSNENEYWVSVYIKPKMSVDSNGNIEEYPRLYSWNYSTNRFGKLNFIQEK